VRITRTADDRAEGRFDPTYAAFMGIRHQPGEPVLSAALSEDVRVMAAAGVGDG
jgi:hypothetical protein